MARSGVNPPNPAMLHHVACSPERRSPELLSRELSRSAGHRPRFSSPELNRCCRPPIRGSRGGRPSPKDEPQPPPTSPMIFVGRHALRCVLSGTNHRLAATSTENLVSVRITSGSPQGDPAVDLPSRRKICSFLRRSKGWQDPQVGFLSECGRFAQVS